MQTMEGTDTANVRNRGVTQTSAVVFVEEEKSHDRETDHKAETVGFMALFP